MCPLVFQGHLSNFKVTRWKILSILTQIGCFRTITPVWIHQWLWNYAQGLKQHRRRALLFFKVIRQISRSRMTQNCRFWPELRVSGLYLQFEFTHDFEMMHKAYCGREKVPYCFQGHPSNFKVTLDKKVPILNRIERFWTVTPVWIHPWFWNDAQSLM